jgi:hypothetical protein
MSRRRSLELVRPVPEYLRYQVGSLPGRGKLVLTFLDMYSLQN